MVEDGCLLIAPTAVVPSNRVHALLQHETGTHIVTHVNGSRQPLRLLGAGLAGYDETQEGLAVLAEYLAGGLTARRSRQLAARVVAVHQMCDGQSFATVHRSLVDNGVARAEALTNLIYPAHRLQALLETSQIAHLELVGIDLRMLRQLEIPPRTTWPCAFKNVTR